MSPKYERRWHEHPVALALLSWDLALSLPVGLGTYFGSRADLDLLHDGTTVLVAGIQSKSHRPPSEPPQSDGAL